MMLTPELAQTLLFFGAGFILLEAFVFTIGVIGLIGLGITLVAIITLVKGEPMDLLDLSDPLVLTSHGIMVIVTGVVIWLVIRAMRKQVETGREAMIGEQVTVLEWQDGQGRIEYEGETWNAVSDTSFQQGDLALITKIDKLTLHLSDKGE